MTSNHFDSKCIVCHHRKFYSWNNKCEAITYPKENLISQCFCDDSYHRLTNRGNP